jgi:FkbM family methyltransferase
MIDFDLIFKDNNRGSWHAELQSLFPVADTTDDQIVYDFFKNSTGKFLEIGANIGKNGTGWQLLQNNWEGVYCEPDPVACADLMKNIRISNFIDKTLVVNGAITSTIKLSSFYCAINRSAISSLDSTWPNKQPMPGCADVKLQKILTNTITLNVLFDAIGYDFEFISIDTEGTDVELINSMDLSLFPKLKLISTEANFTVAYYMYSCGFVPYAKTASNTYFVNKYNVS